MISAQDAAAKWQANLSNAANAIKSGVQGVSVSPTVTAAGRLDAYIAGTQAAVSSGRMAAKLNAVTLQSWQQATITKGVPRIPAGASAALPKFTAFMGKWLQLQAQNQQMLTSMPRGSLQQNIARAVAVITANANAKGSLT